MSAFVLKQKSDSLFSFFVAFRDDSAEVDVYNPQKNEWDKISPMTQVCDIRFYVSSHPHLFCIWFSVSHRLESYLRRPMSDWVGGGPK